MTITQHRALNAVKAAHPVTINLRNCYSKATVQSLIAKGYIVEAWQGYRRYHTLTPLGTITK